MNNMTQTATPIPPVDAQTGAGVVDNVIPGADTGPVDPELNQVENESAMAAREERLRLMPEYLTYYFLEDLPMLDASDPWNQGIYMRFRINQFRSVTGKAPVE